MRIRSTLLIGLSSTLLAGAPLMAEPFNDRGDLFASTAPAGQQEPGERVSPTSNRFNERNGFFTAESPSGSARPQPPVAATPESFISRSHVAKGTRFRTRFE